MRTTVTELLREFPKIRRAAMRGDRVVIKTRSGNLVLLREEPAPNRFLGSLAALAKDQGLDAEEQVFSPEEWNIGR